MEISAVYKRLHKYASAATGLDERQVIFANQTGEKPPKPFITIDLRSIKQIGTPLIKQIDDEGVENSVLSMRATVTFQCFSSKLYEAEELLLELDAKFNTELADEIFSGNLAKQRILKPVSLIPTFIDSQLELRAIFEVEIAFNRTVSYFVGTIEKVELNNTLNNEKMNLQRELNVID